MRTQRLYRLSEVATILNVSDRTLRRLIAEDQLRVVRVRGSIRVGEAELDRLLVDSSGDDEVDAPDLSQVPAIRAEVRRLTRAWKAARDAFLSTLEDLGGLGVSGEELMRLAISDVWRLDALLDAQVRPILSVMPQTLEELEELEDHSEPKS